MTTVFESDASLKNYNEKMEEIGLDCMHACVHQPCQFFLSIEDPNRQVSECMVTLIRFEIDNVIEKKVYFPLLLDILWWFKILLLIQFQYPLWKVLYTTN